MAWREAKRVDDLFGLAGNARLLAEPAAELAAARAGFETGGAPARSFKGLTWRTLSR